MMTRHEPCISRGDCFHVRGARITNAKPEAREWRARGGRVGGRISGQKAVDSGQLATLNKNPEAQKWRIRGGRVGGRKNVESGQLAEAAKKARIFFLAHPEIQWERNSLGGKIGARITNAKPEAREWRKAGAHRLGLRPTWPEARFYGLVFGWFNGNSKNFRFQEVIPTEHCAHRVDARYGTTIFELDGGGHHVFKDRTEHDRLEDEDYATMGYRVIRAPNETDLFLRVLQTVEDNL